MSELLSDLLKATTVSASGLEITIACDDHDTKDAILDALMASKSGIWMGEASSPKDLAEEIAAMPSSTLRLPYVEAIEIVGLTLSVANRDLLVDALQRAAPPHS